MVDVQFTARKHAKLVSQRLLFAGESARNEADLRRLVGRVLDKYAEETGVQLEQKDEYSVARGRADSVYNRLVLEYKTPGRLADSNLKKANRDAIEQLIGYVRNLSASERSKIDRWAGVICDGKYFIYVRFFEGTHAVDEPIAINEQSTERLLVYLTSTAAGVAVIPDNLVRDFGLQSERARAMIRALYVSLESPKSALVKKLYEQWRLFFSEVAGYQVASGDIEHEAELQELANSLSLTSRIDPARLIFSIHTYYAVLMKLLASLAVGPYLLPAGLSFSRMATLGDNDLRREMTKLEDGGIIREYAGVRNFLEGDFFSWYTHAWNLTTSTALRDVLARLADYDPGTLDVNPEQTRDLLKKLYHYLLPRELRHDLGEYYTPDWLAELTLNRLEGYDPSVPFVWVPGTRILDPACGSGTFLVLAIRAVREQCRKDLVPEVETLEKILHSVVGIDLNPLAAIAARTNYLLAIRDLLPHRKADLEIPVYLADSVLPPTKFVDLEAGAKYPIRTAVATFYVPESVATRDGINRLATLLEEDVHAGIQTNAFLDHARQDLGLPPSEWKAAKPILTALYKEIHQLHKDGLNGIWGRIIKNAFAPLFIGKFHYIVGNPPWINWEALPEKYREETKPLWDSYGLRSAKGQQEKMREGKKDIAMLMTYSVVDRHLEEGGKLGFVITQSVFQSAGAGRGFRRWRLGNGASLKVLHVDDMVRLAPFEGATNRTAVFVLELGRETKYPVPYAVWKPKGKGTLGFDVPLNEVLEEVDIDLQVAEPRKKDDPLDAWLVAPKELLPGIRKILGSTEYAAREGVNTGGANGVYWLEVLERQSNTVVVRNVTENLKRRVERIDPTTIEADLVYSLLRGKDVSRWSATPSISILLVQDINNKRYGIPENILQSKWRKTYSYLQRFKKTLETRPDRRFYPEGSPWYTMRNVADYTLSPYKVVWKYVAADFITAVVTPTPDGKPVIPDCKLMFVPLEKEDEAYYLSGILNSTPIRTTVMSYAVGTQISTHVLDTLRIPRFDSSDPLHKSISRLACEAHWSTHSPSRRELAVIEKELDLEVARLWGLSRDEIKRFLPR